MPENTKIKILFIEDVPSDFELAEKELKRRSINFTSRLVDNKEDFLRELEEFQPDIIISDYSLPNFNGMQALELAKKLVPQTPFIILTGSISEETKVECLLAGAYNYVIKEHITRLSFAVKDALEHKKDRLAKEASERALKISEERYKRFFEEDISADFISSIDGRIFYCNPAFVEMFGFESKEEVYQTNIVALYPTPKDREEFLAKIREEKRVDSVGVEHRRKDGTTIFVIKRAIALYDENGEIDRFQGYIIDITNLKNTEVELIKSKELAEKSNKLKDAFIANMSHEIRTPLNGILGMVSLIKESFSDYVSDVEEEYFKALASASSRITKTIDMILNFSRLQVGDFPTNFKTNDLGQIITNLFDEYKSKAAFKSIDLTITNKCGKVFFESDAYSVTQAISHLLDNAIKFTEKGFVNITLYCSDENNIMLDIQDTGIGISEKYLKNLYEPYSQEEIGYTRTYDGVGLGLPLINKYLELNDAELKVVSKKGVGTTFTILFKRAVTAQPKDKATEKPQISKAASDSFIGLQDKQYSVLIVEDDEVNRNFIKLVLNRTGNYTPICAVSASEALEALRNNKIDLILMDIALSGPVDGLTLTKEIRGIEKYKLIPIIAVTAHALQIDRENSLKAGCNDFIAKPFSKAGLLEIISKNLTNDK